MAPITDAESSLAFDDVGTGPAVILGHSFLCDRSMWRYQVPIWSEDFRVINPDLRGHGDSPRLSRPVGIDEMLDDSIRLLDHLGIERAAWVGLSLGGMIALRAALRAPERVSALVLLDTDAGAESLLRRLEYRMLRAVATVVGIRPLMPRVVRRMFGTSSLRNRKELVAEWSRLMAAQHVPSMRAVLTGLIERESLVDRLGNIEAPAIVICGAEDTSTPPARSRVIAAALTDSEFHIIPAAGHLTALECPAEVTTLVEDFLNRCLDDKTRGVS